MAHYVIAKHEKRFVALAGPNCAWAAVRRWFLQTAGLHSATLRAPHGSIPGARPLHV
jgi:hypothetical protein